MTIPVKWFTNEMRGAPVLNGQPGSLIALLDACLLTGFGIVTPTAVTVADGVATAPLPYGQSFLEHAAVLVSGATPAELNGEARVLTTSTTQITWATTAADGAASGSIEIRYAPVGGWAKVFSGTNLAVYRSTDVQSNGHYLRVDDAGTTFARVRGYESMTDANTGTGPFPLDAQMSGGGYWFKSNAANANANRWKVLADSRLLMLAIAAGSGANAANTGVVVRGFGDPIALRPSGDAWGTILSANGANPGSGVLAGALNSSAQSSAGGFTASPRAWQGLGSAVLLNSQPYTGSSAESGIDGTLGQFPSEVDGQLKFSRRYLVEQGTGKPPRGEIPGLRHIPQTGVLAFLADGDTVIDADGRRLMAVTSTQHNNISSAPNGIVAVDITGPWR